MATVTIFGATGTSPLYGATSCVLAEDCGGAFILDAGTGLASVTGIGRASLLLTHPHLDHLLGLPVSPLVWDAGAKLDAFGPPETADGLTAMFSPPLWPVGIERFKCAFSFTPVSGKGSFPLPGARVSHMPVSHPGGCLAWRLDFSGGGSLVYATDMEQDETDMESFTQFSRGCSLLIADAQYTDEEYALRRGFGHSTVFQAARLGLLCGAGRTLLTHHSPFRTEEEFKALAPEIKKINPSASFAKEGMKLDI